MEFLLTAVVIIFILIWAARLETGINKANEALQRIEQQLGMKKEKK